MELIVARRSQPVRLGILPGSFNPPTRAHVALAEQALTHVDQVLLVLPRVFPHKDYGGASLDQRVELLRALAFGRPSLGVAVSDGGLFIEMAGEARLHFPDSRLFFLCGRDAAERIISWDYDDPSTVERMLRQFSLLVAPRRGMYQPPAHLRQFVQVLGVCGDDECSSTLVRETIRSGGDWQSLVPEEICETVERIYGAR